MSAELKHKSTQFSEHQEEVVNKSVNVNDLIERYNASEPLAHPTQNFVFVN